jgi:hypothetical protein
MCVPVCEFQSSQTVKFSLECEFQYHVQRFSYTCRSEICWCDLQYQSFVGCHGCFSNQEPCGKFGLHSVQFHELRYRHQVLFDDENKFLCSENKKNRTDKYFKIFSVFRQHVSVCLISRHQLVV